ncbi:hypothetical protein PLANPX_2448 [Lacipirellula parvula]|uniref:Uncharacterized protein n=1 Tax=Lacipirellula parvula TaxID=2650471 RepID=A0A5K7XES4_9BACT|nr:hypothetical protein PLANPX_2448 [Lacipirellula parvula]
MLQKFSQGRLFGQSEVRRFDAAAQVSVSPCSQRHCRSNAAYSRLVAGE